MIVHFPKGRHKMRRWTRWLQVGALAICCVSVWAPFGQGLFEAKGWRLDQRFYTRQPSGKLDQYWCVTTFITSSGTYSRPADWDNAANTIECVGGGGGGGGNDSSLSAGAGGGGGGAYSAVTNQNISSSTTVTIGAGGTAGNSTPTDGGAGGDTSFGATCVAKGGAGGQSDTSGGAGGAGGAAASGTGSTKNSGGAGGSNGSTASGGGGGGAAGQHGNGNAGANAPDGLHGGAGGSGDNGSGGSGGAGGNALGPTGPAAGGNGANFDATHGSGGGGGGGITSVGLGDGAAGGNYGGAGGGAGNNSASGGAGKDGLIVVTYTPAVTTAVQRFRLDERLPKKRFMDPTLNVPTVRQADILDKALATFWNPPNWKRTARNEPVPPRVLQPFPPQEPIRQVQFHDSPRRYRVAPLERVLKESPKLEPLIGLVPVVYRKVKHQFPINAVLRPKVITLTLTENCTATDAVVVTVHVSNTAPRPLVRDWWDRDEWGRFIPGSGMHEG